MTDALERAGLAEAAEAEFVLSMAQSAPADVRSELGMRETRLAGGVLTAMRQDPTGGFWNRALGFGFNEPFDSAALAEVLAFYRDMGAPAATLQLSPQAAPSDWESVLAAGGLTAGRSWVKFLTPIEHLLGSESNLEVRRIGPESSEEYARTYAGAFGLPTEGPFFAWIRALPLAPGWQCFGAYDGDTLISAANLFITGSVGVLGGAGTLPENRGRGGQAVLMAARVSAAAEAGCEWYSTETGSESPEDPNPSLHNMRRLGMAELYARTNYLISL